MRVLVTWGTKRGGTAGIGQMLGDALRENGLDVVAAPAKDVDDLDGYDAVVVGGALYANRWARSARRFVNHHVEALRKVPVWFFSSGPLDASADRGEIAPPLGVQVLAERVGAKGHVTFGGRLAPDARGFPAASMARKSSGDWRNPERIRAWGGKLAAELPAARPGEAIDHAARSMPRLFRHAIFGWLLCAALLLLLVEITGVGAARVLHAILSPMIFGVVAWRYFRARGARDPLPTAAIWLALVAFLDLRFLPGTWVAPLLVFVVTWATGAVMSTLPWPAPEKRPAEVH